MNEYISIAIDRSSTPHTNTLKRIESDTDVFISTSSTTAHVRHTFTGQQSEDRADEVNLTFLDTNRNLLNTTEQTVYVVCRVLVRSLIFHCSSIRRMIINITMCPTLYHMRMIYQ
jgi:hypothetical protein